MSTLSRKSLTNNVAAYFIEKHLQKNSFKTAYICEDMSITFTGLYENVNKMASLLKRHNIRSRVGIILPDSMEFIYSFWASIWMGVVPIPINTLCKEEDIDYIINDSQCDFLITNEFYFNKIRDFKGIKSMSNRVLIVDRDGDLLSKLTIINDYITPVPCREDDEAFWLYTSGSTNKPKGVIHTHKSMISSARLYAQETLQINDQDIVYSAAQMPFAYGLGNNLYMPLFVGATSIISSSSNIFEIISEVNKYKPTVFFGIPIIYSLILSVSEIQKFNAFSIRLFLSAAEQLPVVIWERWLKTFGKEIYEGIGSTELLHVFISNRPGDCKPGSSGKPVKGYTVDVLDDKGNKVKPGEVGNLVVQGDSLMKGYWNNPLKISKENKYATGDKYLIDLDGYYYFIGRSDQAFKVNGQWIIPSEIENLILKHPDIDDVAIYPEKVKEEGVVITAYYTTNIQRIDMKALEHEIKQLIRSKLSSNKVPKHLYNVSEIPRNQNGKVNRKLLFKEKRR